MHIYVFVYMGVSLIELSGTYFWVDMGRSVLLIVLVPATSVICNLM